MKRAPRVPAPSGLRWATGGGLRWGDCNGLHLAREDKIGTLCGRVGRATTVAVTGSQICGACARIAKVQREVGA